MELFNTLQNNITKEEKLENLKNDILAKSHVAIMFVQQQHNDMFNLIWNNPTFTPQEIFDAFGVNASELFIASSKAETYLSELIGDDYVPLTAPYEYNINEDGTVTIGNKK